MERRFLRRLLLPTLLIMLCIQVFAAQEQSAVPMRIDPEPGFTTCIEDTDGNTITRNGVPNTMRLRNSATLRRSTPIRSITTGGF